MCVGGGAGGCRDNFGAFRHDTYLLAFRHVPPLLVRRRCRCRRRRRYHRRRRRLRFYIHSHLDLASSVANLSEPRSLARCSPHLPIPTPQQFSAYIRNYMKAYPHIPPEEFPTFEDFDMNRDGLVTFQEWQEYLCVPTAAAASATATANATLHVPRPPMRPRAVALPRTALRSGASGAAACLVDGGLSSAHRASPAPPASRTLPWPGSPLR